MRRELRTGYILTILAAVVWATTSPAIKYLLDTLHVPALAIAFWRDAFIATACGLVLLAVIFLGERLEWPQLLGIALILGAVGLPRLPAGDERHASTADVLKVGEPVADG